MMMNNENENNEITVDDLIEEIIIGSEDVEKFVNGYTLENEFSINLRKNCIFRGLSKETHELIPKALRKENDTYVICKYIHQNVAKDYHSANFKDIGCGGGELTLELQYKREFFILFRFLDWADKSGLTVPVDMETRKLLHSFINHPFNSHWPQSKYYEIIALAQHHGLPTCALDWSYNFKVSLYFAVKDILNEDVDEKYDGILWAFNYKHFEKESKFVIKHGIKKEEKPQLRFYRPQYFYNHNIKAQKGLFTFLINDINTFDANEIKPLDKFVCDIVKDGGGVKKENSEIEIDLHGIENFTLKNDEKIFYKFIIKKECKADILEKLYSSYYSEEYLFPGYQGVADAMKNWAVLQNIKNKKIMFICRGNICRSVIAEALFNKMVDGKIGVYSSGIMVNREKPSRNTIQVCKHHGLDVSKHKASCFKDSNIEDMDLVLTFEMSHKEKILSQYPNLKVHTIKEFIGECHVDIKDPYGSSYDVYEEYFNEICGVLKRIKVILEEKKLIR